MNLLIVWQSIILKKMTSNPPTQDEKNFYYCMHGSGGSFMTKLYAAIMAADTINKHKLSLGFPEEVKIAIDYQEKPGYWEELCNKMKV